MRIDPPVRSAHAMIPKPTVAAAPPGRARGGEASRPPGGAPAPRAAGRPARVGRTQPVSIPNGASSSAMCSRNSASLCAPIAPTQNSRPLSTGYSMAPPCSLPSPSIQPVR